MTIKIILSSTEEVNPVLYRAIKFGYSYNPEQYQRLKHAHSIVLSSDYGINPVHDSEELTFKHKTVTAKEFLG